MDVIAHVSRAWGVAACVPWSSTIGLEHDTGTARALRATDRGEAVPQLPILFLASSLPVSLVSPGRLPLGGQSSMVGPWWAMIEPISNVAGHLSASRRAVRDHVMRVCAVCVATEPTRVHVCVCE